MEMVEMMEFIQPTAEDISLEEAAAIARVSTKTLRRAAASGILPRTYVISERGPRLVFQRDILDRWLATRRRKPRRAPATSPNPALRADHPSWQEVRESLAAFQSTLESSRRAIAGLAAQLQRQDGSVAQAQATLAKLNETLATVNQRIESQVAALPAGPNRPTADQAASTC
jgi:peptidoglycan hydrolase CwlO-like protein